MTKPTKLTESQEEILVVAVRRGGVVETEGLRQTSIDALRRAGMIEYRVTRKGRHRVKQLTELDDLMKGETREE